MQQNKPKLRRIKVDDNDKEPMFLERAFDQETYNQLPFKDRSSNQPLNIVERREPFLRMIMKRIRIETDDSGAIQSVWIKKRVKASRSQAYCEWREVWRYEETPASDGYIEIRGILEPNCLYDDGYERALLFELDPTEKAAKEARYLSRKLSVPHEVLSILGNRNHFRFCYCCGQLEQIDWMENRVCINCLDSPKNIKNYTFNNLRSHFKEIYFSESEIQNINSEKLDEIGEVRASEMPVYTNMSENNTKFDKTDEELYLTHLFFNEIHWSGPHESYSIPRLALKLPLPISKSDNSAIFKALCKVINDRRFFDNCFSCGEVNHVDHGGGDTCFSCMEGNGVVF